MYAYRKFKSQYLNKRIFLKKYKDMEDLSVWDNFGCAEAADTVNRLVGTQSQKLTKNNAVITYMNTWYRPSAVQNWSRYSMLDFNLRIVDKTNLDTVAVTLHATAGDAVNYTGLWTAAAALSTGWNRMQLKKSDFTDFNAGSWSAVAELRITMNFSTDNISRVFNLEDIYIK